MSTPVPRVGSPKHYGYVPTPEAEAVHQRAARGEITCEEAVRIVSDWALNQDMKKIDIAAIEAARRGPARPARRCCRFFGDGPGASVSA